jgi:hypothetical protein
VESSRTEDDCGLQHELKSVDFKRASRRHVLLKSYTTRHEGAWGRGDIAPTHWH